LVENEDLNDPRIIVTTKTPHDTWDNGMSDGMGPWSPFSELVRIRRASRGDNFPYQTGPSHVGPRGIL
jgi:hypothetical protein